MEMEFIRVTIASLDQYLPLRLAQLKEESGQSTDELYEPTRRYCERRLADGTFFAWIAQVNEESVASAAISIAEKPPYPANPSGRIGLLSSMYTRPEYRRAGIAKKLLALVVEDAKAAGCGVVHITASDMGVLLYTAFGFEPNKNFMQFVIK